MIIRLKLYIKNYVYKISRVYMDEVRKEKITQKKTEYNKTEFRVK